MKTILFLCLVCFSMASFACEQRGFIQSVSMNKNLISFKLDNGFTIKLDTQSPLIPLLYHATANNDEICATHIEKNTTGEDFGSPRQVTVRKQSQHR